MTARHNPSAGEDHAIARAGEADTGVLAQVIADAFFGLDVSRWLIPDGAARRVVFPRWFRMVVVHAMTGGLVYTTAERTAAALWIPGTGPDAPPEGYDEELAEVTGPWLERFLVFDQELEAHHVTGTAHHHLAILAVRPDVQDRGTGTALLNAHHARLDQDRTAGYLEASGLRTRAVYLRHGYTDYGSLIRLPDGPSMYPMTRQPRAGGG